MHLYPLFADLHDRPVLVVGGGMVAARKVRALLACGAEVTVGAPTLDPDIQAWISRGRVGHRAGRFAADWLADTWLVVAATDDNVLNAEIAEAATQRRILANVVDDPRLSSFQVPAIIDHSPLIIAISTAGAAPMLARRLRERVEQLLDHTLGPLVAMAQRHRTQIKSHYPRLAERRRFYDWLHDGPVARQLRQHRSEMAEATLQKALQEPPVPSPHGEVLLVGAGPGDPGLLTLHALRALNQADVIVHDRLVAPEILDMARRDAQRVDAGKHPGEDHAATQRRIHRILVEHARAGRCVVRLKGGDPFIFGRGGEELEVLRAHHIDYRVIPGITAASACAAYAGIPLTHRDHAQSVRLVTAHCKQSLDTLDWPALAQERQTLAIYMGVAQLHVLTRHLLAHGRSPDTPFALIENGSMPTQRVVDGQLRDLPVLARRHDVHAPALLIIGEVAALSSSLDWFSAATGATVHPVAAAA